MTMRKSQSAMEFVVLATFMLFVVLGFFAVTTSKVLEAEDEKNRKITEDIANIAYREIEIAKSSHDGYIRTFYMPQTVNGINYSIKIIDDRELIVEYLEHEYVKFIPSNVTGNISWGLTEIKKFKGIVYLKNVQPPLECNDKLDNDGDGAIDLSDAGCIDKYDDDETNCGDDKCEGGEGCLFCSADCGICPMLRALLMKNDLADALTISKNGDAFLRGSLYQGVTPQDTSNDEFIVRSSTGTNIAVINLLTGDMFISGNKFENQAALTPSSSSSDFIVKDNAGNTISYIDDFGNFFLKGTLNEGFGQPPISKVFVLQDSSGANVASFDNRGNLVLKGTLKPMSEYVASPDEFKVQNSVGNDVAVIDLTTGNMYIAGTLSPNSNPIESSNIFDFAITTDAGEIVALIKDDGNLLLKGTLTPNGNP